MEAAAPERVSEQLDRWWNSESPKTVGGFIDEVDEKGFALLFVFLLAPTALPIPTGGLTHIFELVSMLLALQLIAGREEVWLPQRVARYKLDGERMSKAIPGLIRYVAKIERFARPRGRIIFEHRFSDIAFGVAALIGTVAAAVAPPFSGLDTLPALGVVIIAIGVLIEDALFVIAGTVVIAAGMVVELLLGKAAYEGVKSLF